MITHIYRFGVVLERVKFDMLHDLAFDKDHLSVAHKLRLTNSQICVKNVFLYHFTVFFRVTDNKLELAVIISTVTLPRSLNFSLFVSDAKISKNHTQRSIFFIPKYTKL